MIPAGAHSLLSHDHGTPDPLLRLEREVLGGVADVDPASSPKWNARIGARRIITVEEDCRVTPWFLDAPAPHRLATDRRVAPPENPGETARLNPPNDRRGKLVAFCWRTLVEYFLRGWCRSAIWVGFSVEQLSRLQRVGARRHPLQLPTLVPRARVDYIDGGTLAEQTDAPHASFITLLSRTPREIETFAALGSELGCVVNGDRY